MIDEVKHVHGIELEGHPLMRPKEVAQRLKFDLSTIYSMVEAGELEAIRRTAAVKSHIRITRRSLLLWCARNATLRDEDFSAILLAAAKTVTPQSRRLLIAALEAVR